MKKKLYVVLSCLACAGILFSSTMPVQAVNSGSCSHTYYEDSVVPVPTGVYDYGPGGHYAQYGIRHYCFKCGWIEYVDTYFECESSHNYPNIATSCQGTHIYNCTTDGCPYFEVGPCTPETCPKKN